MGAVLTLFILVIGFIYHASKATVRKMDDFTFKFNLMKAEQERNENFNRLMTTTVDASAEAEVNAIVDRAFRAWRGESAPDDAEADEDALNECMSLVNRALSESDMDDDFKKIERDQLFDNYHMTRNMLCRLMLADRGHISDDDAGLGFYNASHNYLRDPINVRNHDNLRHARMHKLVIWINKRLKAHDAEPFAVRALKRTSHKFDYDYHPSPARCFGDILTPEEANETLTYYYFIRSANEKLIGIQEKYLGRLIPRI